MTSPPSPRRTASRPSTHPSLLLTRATSPSPSPGTNLTRLPRTNLRISSLSIKMRRLGCETRRILFRTGRSWRYLSSAQTRLSLARAAAYELGSGGEAAEVLVEPYETDEMKPCERRSERSDMC